MERGRRLADLLAVAAGELLANVLDHLPLARDHLQRLGDVLTQLAQPRAAAALAGCRPRHDHPLARQVLGEGLARRPLAGEGHDSRRLRNRALGGDLVLAGRTLEFLERQLHLVEQPQRPFRALAVELPGQLFDLQSLMCDYGGIVGSLGLGDRQFRLDPRRPGALGNERRPQRVNIVRQVFASGSPWRNGITNPGRRLAENTAGYPARCGRNVWRGFRQSMPSSM